VASDLPFLQVAGVALFYLALGVIACGILLTIAWAQARATVYTITTERVAMRIGAALNITLNIPFSRIGAANLDLRRDGTGSIALSTLGDTTFSYLVLWPHVRPWHTRRTEPTLRCVPDAERISQLLSEAAETRLNRPVVAPVAYAGAMAAE
jgi:hypothetical protein